MQPRTLAGLSLRDLEYAVATAELRHFGKAAERCAVSQPALSEQIRKLEALLGVRLFERRARPIELTAQGRIVIDRARRVLDEARCMLACLQSATDLAGPLSLAAIETLGPYYLPHVLHQVRSAFPDVALRLEEGRTAALLDGLRQSRIDLVLAALPLPAPDLTTIPVFFEPFLLACPRGHRLAQLRSPRLEALTDNGLLLLEEGHCLRDQALALCGDRPQQRRHHVTSLETLWQMIAAGDGYSLLPWLAVQARAAQRDRRVVCRRFAGDPVGRTIGLVWRSDDRRSPAFRQLASLLRNALPDGVDPVVDPLPDPAAA